MSWHMKQLAYDRMNNRDQGAASASPLQLIVINTKNRCGVKSSQGPGGVQRRQEHGIYRGLRQPS